MIYPTISLFLYDIFGIKINLPIQTFGFFVAIAFLTASYILMLELKRKEKEGLVQPINKKILVGQNPSIFKIITSCIFTFIISFKIGGIILEYNEFWQNPQNYIISQEGSILIGLIFTFFKLYKTKIQHQKNKLIKPQLTEKKIHAYELVGNITTIAAVSGIIGAKIFSNLENFSAFKADPIGELFSFSGLTFYGGFIFGAISVLWYINKNRIKVYHFIDAVAPSLMIAYGIGRMGCHFAGDGDWGIVNNTPKPNWLPIPDWMWSYTYPHNILGNNASSKIITGTGEEIPVGSIQISSCDQNKWDNPYTEQLGDYCYELSQPVYPTAIYEIIMCFVLFAVLWKFRKKFNPGIIFCIYLIFNGIERFLIEEIRITEVITWGLTQAQIISFLLIIIGLTGILLLRKKNKLILKN